MLGAAVLDTVLRYVFLTWSGRVGQAVLLTLRRRVFLHVQRLPLSFHERYTSGKTISRLTSDVEALAELLDEGLDNLVTAIFSVLTIGVVLVVLDPPLGLVALLGFPALFWVARWFQRNSTAAYRRTRETIAALIVQFTETFGGIRAVQAFRREPRNDELQRRAQRGQPAGARPRVLADRRLRAGGDADREPGHRRRPRLRRAAGDGRRPRRRHAGVVPALPAPVLRPAAGRRDVLQLLPVGDRRAGEAVRACSRSARRCPSRATRCRCPGPRGEVVFERRAVRLHRPHRPAGARPDRPRRRDGGAGRRHRGGQVDPRPARGAVLRPPGRRRAARRRAAGPARGRRPAPGRGDGDPGELPVLRDRRRQHRASGGPGRAARRSRRRPGRSGRTSSSPACRRATTPTSASAAGGCRPGSGSW